jgi:hypothetical protein
MLVAGLLLFSAALILIAFVVNAHAFATAADHFTANVSLTEEARKAALEAARSGALIRTLLFGPGAIVFGSAGLFTLVSGQRRRR